MCCPGENTKLSSTYVVGGDGIGEPCDLMEVERRKKFYCWRNASFGYKASSKVPVRETLVKNNGHRLGNDLASLGVGVWLLVDAFSDEEDDLWLGKTVAFPGDHVCIRQQSATTVTNSTRFDKGDYMIAVQWYERFAECTAERREFIMGEPGISVVNSTELRHFGFQMDEVGAKAMSTSLKSSNY